jgi:ankyrin repeat protein
VSDYIKSLEKHCEELENKLSMSLKELYEFKKKYYLRDITTNTFIDAAAFGMLDAVKFHIEEGVDIHEAEDSALRSACINGHLEVVKFLIEAGADIHARNDQALEFASNEVHKEVVEYLKSLGCKIDE